MCVIPNQQYVLPYSTLKYMIFESKNTYRLI